MPSTTLKTTVPREVYEAAQIKAKASDTTIAAVLREALEAWVSDASDTSKRGIDQPTTAEEQWQACRHWLTVNSYTIDFIQADVGSDLGLTRKVVMAWARSRGWTGDAA